MKKKKLSEVMRTFLRFRPTAELRRWRVCDGCGKRFSEQKMVWIDTQGWLCGECQMKIS